MSVTKIAGVMRAGAYSPNHIGNDAAIFNAAAEQLRKRGYLVNVYSEEQFRSGTMGEQVVVNMCREAASIGKLQQLEDEGVLVINSGYGIENCTRERMTRLLLGNGIPYPESLIVNTNEAVIPELKRAGFTSCWIKRGDFHAMHKEDVSYCRHPEEAQDVLQEYFYRGIKRAVINKHLTGDLIKFYGIAGTDFFYWFYPFDTGHRGKNPHCPGIIYKEMRRDTLPQADTHIDGDKPKIAAHAVQYTSQTRVLARKARQLAVGRVKRIGPYQQQHSCHIHPQRIEIKHNAGRDTYKYRSNRDDIRRYTEAAAQQRPGKTDGTVEHQVKPFFGVRRL